MDCYYHGYSGGPGGPCQECERTNGENAGYYKAAGERAKLRKKYGMDKEEKGKE